MNQIFSYFTEGFLSLSWQNFVMYGIGALLIYLAIKKKYEPMLLLPIGFGAILVNLPFEIVWQHGETSGVLKILFETGIMTELFPLLIFISAFIAYKFFGFSIPEAASIGVIGAADGPTSILVTSKFAPNLLGPITVVAYSYMSLVPIIMPPVIKLLTTKNERKLHVISKDCKIPQWVMIAFPIALTLIVGILVPMAAPLLGFLMFGNLIKESGVLEKLAKSAQNELANIVTLLLGISVGATMRAENFLQIQTLLIMILGLIAFVGDTICGVLFAKLINLFRKKENHINPMIGACGLSAFPMASRVVQKIALEEDNQNFLLMHAVSANVSGQIGSVLIGGLILGIVPLL